MSNTNQDDWIKPIMRGTFSPSHGPVSASARTLSSRMPSVGEVTEEWIIPGIGAVPFDGQTTNHANTPPQIPSSSTSVPASNTKPDWATPTDEGFIYPEGYTTKIVGIDSILAARISDAQSPHEVPKHSIGVPTPKGDVKLDINDRGVKTPPLTPGPSPSTPSKQAGVKTTPPTIRPPPNTPSQISIAIRTTVKAKATHTPACLSPPNCTYPTNRTVKFVDDVEVIPGESSYSRPSGAKEHKRPTFHRQPPPSTIFHLVQEVQVPEHIVRELGLSKDGTPAPPSSVPPNTPERTGEVAERGGETPPPSPGPPLNSPSMGLSKDGTPPPPPSELSNTPAKHLSKGPSPPPPSPPPNTQSKELPKGGGGGETPPPPSPPPNSPIELSKDGTPPPPSSPPPNTPSMRLSKGGTPSPPPSPQANTPVERLSRPSTPRLTLVIPDDAGDSHNSSKPKSVVDGDRKPSLVDYTSDDDYPSPDPGSDSPIAPLWLEMKAMVDKFIFKTEEEEANRNIAKRPELIPLPPSELTSPAVEVQIPKSKLDV